MSYTEAIVTGVVFASIAAIENYIINKLLIRPLDRRWALLEKWVKAKVGNGKLAENDKENLVKQSP